MRTGGSFDVQAETSSRESFGELLGQLSTNSAALVRNEIALARQEVSEKIAGLRSGIILVAVGSVLGLIAILTLTAAAVIGLSKYVGPGNAALIVGLMLAIISATTALVGLSQIKRMA